MASRLYALGMIISFAAIGIGITAYIKTENIQSLGLKTALYGALILSTLIWPIALPTAIALVARNAINKTTEKLFKDAEEKIEEVTKKKDENSTDN